VRTSAGLVVRLRPAPCDGVQSRCCTRCCTTQPRGVSETRSSLDLSSKRWRAQEDLNPRTRIRRSVRSASPEHSCAHAGGLERPQLALTGPERLHQRLHLAERHQRLNFDPPTVAVSVRLFPRRRQTRRPRPVLGGELDAISTVGGPATPGSPSTRPHGRILSGARRRPPASPEQGPQANPTAVGREAATGWRAPGSLRSQAYPSAPQQRWPTSGRTLSRRTSS